MRIEKITHRNRNDFTAIFACEHCGKKYTASGYEDVFFHQTVLPAVKCPGCKLPRDKDHIPSAGEREHILFNCVEVML